MFHDLVVILNLSYYYHVAMFQGMRNSCCIHMLHYYHSQAIKYETNIIENVAYTCFSTMAWWGRWCTCLWMKCNFVGAKHLGCYMRYRVAWNVVAASQATLRKLKWLKIPTKQMSLSLTLWQIVMLLITLPLPLPKLEPNSTLERRSTVQGKGEGQLVA